jgi:hypothetical protein
MDNLLIDCPSVLVVVIHVHFVTVIYDCNWLEHSMTHCFFLFGITQILICSWQGIVVCDSCAVSTWAKTNSQLLCWLSFLCGQQLSEGCWVKEFVILGLSSLSKVCHLKVDKLEHTEDLQTLPGISCKTGTYKETVVWTLKTVLHQWCAWRICSGCRRPQPLLPM